MAEDKRGVTKKTTATDSKPVTKKTSSKKATAKKTASTKTSGTPTTTSAPKKTVTKKAASGSTAASTHAPAGSPATASARSAPVTKKTSAKAREERPVTLKPVTEVTPEERHRMIEEAAFYIAEKRGFAPGDDAADWAAAEAEIDEQLRKGGP